jgi:AcrR family transcriptional regulator
MKTEKPNRKKIQGAETKKRLYESAEKLFSNNKFAAVSVESIAEAAGVTKGTFYVHFDSKDELYLSVFNDFVSQLDMDYRAFIDALPADMPASDVLLALIGRITDVLVGSIGYENMKNLYTVQLTRDVDTAGVNGYNRDLYKLFSDVLDRGIQRGEFQSSLPLEDLARHFVLAVRGLTYEWCIRYPDFDLREQAVAHYKILLTGLRKAWLKKSDRRTVCFAYLPLGL